MRIFVAALLASVACSGGSSFEATVRFDDGLVIQAEVADTINEQATGLMGRTELADGTGMLFTWDEVKPRDFWMRETLIELDLIAIADGVVVSIHSLVPCEADPCPITTTEPADAALEVPAGTAQRAGIGAGARVAWTEP